MFRSTDDNTKLPLATIKDHDAALLTVVQVQHTTNKHACTSVLHQESILHVVAADLVGWPRLGLRLKTGLPPHPSLVQGASKRPWLLTWQRHGLEVTFCTFLRRLRRAFVLRSPPPSLASFPVLLSLAQLSRCRVRVSKWQRRSGRLFELVAHSRGLITPQLQLSRWFSTFYSFSRRCLVYSGSHFLCLSLLAKETLS